MIGEGAARERLPPLVAGDQMRALGRLEDQLGLGRLARPCAAPGRSARAGPGPAPAPPGRRAGHSRLASMASGPAPRLADGDDGQLHRVRKSGAGCRCGGRSRPTRSSRCCRRCALPGRNRCTITSPRIQQHPVTVRQARNLDLAQALFLHQRAEGDRPARRRGGATGPEAMIMVSDIGLLPLQVDQDDVLRLVVVKTCARIAVLERRSEPMGRGACGPSIGDPSSERMGSNLVHFVRRVGNGGVLRVIRGRGGQRRAPRGRY
jgi:hypothetical protein